MKATRSRVFLGGVRIECAATGTRLMRDHGEKHDRTPPASRVIDVGELVGDKPSATVSTRQQSRASWHGRIRATPVDSRALTKPRTLHLVVAAWLLVEVSG